MRSISRGAFLGVAGTLLLVAADARAQQVTVSTPYHSLSDGFFENMGTSWGLSGPNWSFSFGGSPLQAAPQFGGFDPSAGANFGFYGSSGGVRGGFNANWSQGYRQSFTSQVPSVTLTNGMPGYVADTSVSPFVISYVPVVGSYPGVRFPGPALRPPTPGASGVGRDAVVNALQRARAERALKERLENANAAEAEAARLDRPASDPPDRGRDDFVLIGPGATPPGASEASPATEGTDKAMRKLAAARASSAGQPAPSVNEARRLHAEEQAEKTEEALKYEELGRNAEANGKPNVAKVYYRMAAGRASGELRARITARLDALETSGNVPQ
jgi:hypothetical protein